MKPLSTIALKGKGLPLWLSVGHFIFRAPTRLKRMDLPLFLLRLAVSSRRGADFLRIERLSRRWFRLPCLRNRNTCYLRSLVLFRFLDPGDADLCLHFGIDEPESPEERLHGHAWVSLDGIGLNPPPSAIQGRLREIYRFSLLNGGSSTSGAKFAGAMFQNDALYPEPELPKRV
ncbi:MAG: lasso peptide biosynthesis protein [Proteobacteria bacterium]|nr:lasso peptide biosynthesis protein [Pseudomonadota bacterium]MBU4471458.1 lasso peptide biosynthesis protein [Pseudomonadota bacterium]